MEICRTSAWEILTLICLCRSRLSTFHCLDVCRLLELCKYAGDSLLQCGEYLVSWDSSDASTGTASPGRNVTGTGSHRRRGRAGGGWGRGSGRGIGAGGVAGGRRRADCGCGRGRRRRRAGLLQGAGENLNRAEMRTRRHGDTESRERDSKVEHQYLIKSRLNRHLTECSC